MRISDWISDVCSADLRARITFVVIPFSSVKQTAAGQKQVKSSGYGHGQANRRDLEDAKSGLSRNARHVIDRSEEHTSELQSLMRNSYAVFCLKKKTKNNNINKRQKKNTQ